MLQSITYPVDTDLFCLYCGHKVVTALDGDPSTCPHVLFIGNHEEGYYYVSDLAADMLPSDGDDEPGVDEDFRDRLYESKGLAEDSFIVEIAPNFLEGTFFIGFGLPPSRTGV